jgi:lipopolysaccharide/colanic/teichoic acid biosynthesis glycosyltransferase
MSAQPLIAPVSLESAAAAPTLFEPWTTRASYLRAKRCFDVVVALALLLLLLPVLLMVVAAIMIESGRPAFFVQKRMGARPKRRRKSISWSPELFGVVKFRTMVQGADQSPIHEEFVRAFTARDTSGASSDGLPYKLADDPRITRVGRFLRETSLDELPQLINVITGDMSLVGPRPVPAYEVAAYDDHHWERLAALPGITGPWQVEGRGRVTFDEMMNMDIEYVRRQSLAQDLGLLARTLPIVFNKKGAR